jgi:RNA polymerase sigma factor (sigma-70 family)
VSKSERLVEDYQSLAYGMARKYADRGLPLEDLRQEAMLGLLKAAELYDEDAGAEFSTYAVYWIKKFMLAALERETRNKHCHMEISGNDPAEPIAPNTTQEDSKFVLPEGIPPIEARILFLSYGKKLPLKKIADITELTVEKIKQIRTKALRRLKSMEGRKEDKQATSVIHCR